MEEFSFQSIKHPCMWKVRGVFIRSYIIIMIITIVIIMYQHIIRETERQCFAGSRLLAGDSSTRPEVCCAMTAWAIAANNVCESTSLCKNETSSASFPSAGWLMMTIAILDHRFGARTNDISTFRHLPSACSRPKVKFLITGFRHSEIAHFCNKDFIFWASKCSHWEYVIMQCTQNEGPKIERGTPDTSHTQLTAYWWSRVVTALANELSDMHPLAS